MAAGFKYYKKSKGLWATHNRPTHFLNIPLVNKSTRSHIQNSLQQLARDINAPVTTLKSIDQLSLRFGTLSIPDRDAMTTIRRILEDLCRDKWNRVLSAISENYAGDIVHHTSNDTFSLFKSHMVGLNDAAAFARMPRPLYGVIRLYAPLIDKTN